jgi:hypothetical protein
MLEEKDIPLIRGGKLSKEALRRLTEIEKHFPGATKDIVIVRRKQGLANDTNRTQRRPGPPALSWLQEFLPSPRARHDLQASARKRMPRRRPLK